MPELISQGLGIFVIAFIGGFAGAVVRHFTAFIGKRVEQKVASWDTLAQLIAENLAEIRELSIEYWSHDESEQLKPKASRIVALCENVPDLYGQLFEKDPDTTSNLNVKMNSLSKLVTGGSFQQTDRKADQAKIAEIETRLMALDIAIRLKKAKLSYPWY